ncbi:hypothetical protein EI94DRAFT_1717968 [Lactarius quietus]|nr:hypothetical protein EI94DRAFT_1717968 [Lactarius quietus]
MTMGATHKARTGAANPSRVSRKLVLSRKKLIPYTHADLERSHGDKTRTSHGGNGCAYACRNARIVTQLVTLRVVLCFGSGPGRPHGGTVPQIRERESEKDRTKRGYCYGVSRVCPANPSKRGPRTFVRGSAPKLREARISQVSQPVACDTPLHSSKIGKNLAFFPDAIQYGGRRADRTYQRVGHSFLCASSISDVLCIRGAGAAYYTA